MACNDIKERVEVLALLFDVKALVERVLQSCPSIVQSPTQTDNDVLRTSTSNNLQQTSILSALIESASAVEQANDVNVIEIKAIQTTQADGIEHHTDNSNNTGS